MKTIGLVILILGIFMTMATGIKVITHKKVADIGPIEITKEEKTPLYWSPWTGLLLIGIGGAVILSSRNKASS